MTDKEKILAEIERQIELNNNIDPVTTAQQLVVDSVNVVLTDLLDYINSLPEEPVSDDIDIFASEYVKDPDNWVEWIGNHGETDDISYIIKAIKAGAQWQKEQMMKNVVYAHVFGKDNGLPLYCFKGDNENAICGQSLKVIIIKEG